MKDIFKKSIRKVWEQKSILILFILFSSGFAQTPPTMPKTSPGGSDAFIYQGFDSAFYGTDVTNSFWLFEPKDPKPAQEYVIVYWHGTTSLPKEQVGSAVVDFCAEVVKRGYTVVAPLYQWGGYSPSNAEKISIFESITAAAFDELDKTGHVHPVKDINGKVIYGVIGYSQGGSTVLIGAGNLISSKITFPKSILCFAPSTNGSSITNKFPADTKLAIQVGTMDKFVSSAESIWPALVSIPCENKIYLQVNPNNGISYADHAYHTMANVDANDYYASWKFSVGLADCAMKDKNCEYVLSNKDSITFMGKYSNGSPLNPMTIKGGACSCLKEPATYLTTDKTITIDPSAGSTTTRIKSDGKWKVAENADWISINVDSGIFDMAITVTFTANTSSEERMGLIFVHSPGFKVDTVMVIQFGRNLSVSRTSVNLGSVKYSQDTIRILSNTDWFVSTNDSWLSVSQTSGSKDRNITIKTSSDNPDQSYQRQGIIQIGSTGLKTITINVLQNGSILAASENNTICYPNPAEDVVFLNSTEDINAIRIINMQGVLVFSQTLNDYKNGIDVSGWNTGIYLLIAESVSGHFLFRFVKQ